MVDRMVIEQYKHRIQLLKEHRKDFAVMKDHEILKQIIAERIAQILNTEPGKHNSHESIPTKLNSHLIKTINEYPKKSSITI